MHPGWVLVAPKFSLLPKNPTIVMEGFPVWLDCVGEGDPKPTVQWDKNLKMNDFDRSRSVYISYWHFLALKNYLNNIDLLLRFVVYPNGTLFISEVHQEDSNSYGCTAGSSAGLNRKEIRLVVQSKPYPVPL